ncbi:hypothetical protein [Maribacter sp. 2307ULW6-5]|uniref:hypothetical protein n=1 Tax=Maribacter sp. 2307ULW6-5 TaxID=3386275 RepID=UPI0039BCB756
MKNTNVGRKIFTELDHLIALSTKHPKRFKRFERLHVALLKKYYKATDVEMDYHRNRVKMNIVMDENAFSHKKVVTDLEVLPTNMIYANLRQFLTSCIDTNDQNLGFYARLLRSFSNKGAALEMA